MPLALNLNRVVLGTSPLGLTAGGIPKRMGLVE